MDPSEGGHRRPPVHKRAAKTARTRSPTQPDTDPIESAALHHQASVGSLLEALDHDIRNAINVIKSASFSVQTRIKEPDARTTRNLELLNIGCDNAVRLLQEIKEYSEAGPPLLEPGPAASITREELDRIGLPGSRVTWKCDADLPDVALDEVYLRMTLRKLISRALNVTPAPSPILVEVRRSHEGVEIIIEDQGPPISEKQREALFRTSTGTGPVRPTTLLIGMVGELMRQLGGTARCDPAGNAGSRIVLALRNENPGAHPSADEPAPANESQ